MKIKTNLPLVILCLLLNFSLSAKIIFVDNDVVGGSNDGSSWQNAFLDFQTAINEASCSDTIWVAEGVYKPTNGTDREIFFELKNGVKWYGGFQGNESDITQRDFELHPTILDGDIGILGDSIDNSYHLVYTLGTDSTTVIDGFQMINGYAEHELSTYFGHFEYGGGMSVDVDFNNPNAYPQILNCTFQDNFGTRGGGLSLRNNLLLNINPTIDNCKFINNKSLLGEGGGIYRQGGSFTGEEYLISNCYFEKNKARSFGGGFASDEMINPQIFNNCQFIENQAYVEGGGAFIYFGNFLGLNYPISFLNCDFERNFCVNPSDSTNNSRGGGFSYYGLSSGTFDSENLIWVKGCNFIENSARNPGGGIFYGIDFSAQIKIEQSNFIKNKPTAVLIESGIPPPSLDTLEINTIISECVFRDNDSPPQTIISRAAAVGIWINGSINLTTKKIAKTKILNSIFEDNRIALGLGDGLISSQLEEETFVVNCTFVNNDEISILKSIPTDPNSFNDVNIINTIFWEDLSTDQMFKVNTPGGSSNNGFFINHCLFKAPDCLLAGTDICGDGMLFGVEPEFRDPLNHDFSLSSCSPLLNVGDDFIVDTLGILTDIENHPRILDDAVDMGAYETQALQIFGPQISQVSCNGLEDGAISWVQHGTPPFLYEWENGMSSDTNFISSLPTGDYNITVTDADSCILTFQASVNEPSPILVSGTVTNATGNNMDGSIVPTVMGGTPDYEFNWSTGSEEAMIQNLSGGTYTVTIVDANNCLTIQEFVVDEMTGVESYFKNNEITLMPNVISSNETSTLLFEIEKNEDFVIELLNEIGQIIFYKKISISAGEFNFQIPTPKSSGMFFIKIKNDKGEIKTMRWMIL